MEKVKLDDEEEKIKFYPIWKFHAAHKYYPETYEVGNCRNVCEPAIIQARVRL